MTSSSPKSLGTLDIAMEHAERLLDAEPALAAEQIQEILNVAPNHPPAVLMLVKVHRRLGHPEAALAVLEPLVQEHIKWADAYFEMGLILAELGRGNDAVEALKKTVELKPRHPDAWRVLADHLIATGDSKSGDAAYACHVQCSIQNPLLQQAAAAMVKNDVPNAERLLKEHLKQAPTDVPAIRMLAEVAVRCDRSDDGKKLLERCLELAPSFSAARFNYAALLQRGNNSAQALVEIEQLLTADPQNPSYRNLQAVIFGRIGEYERSGKIYAQILNEYPGHAKIWMSYGHVLKTQGRQEKAITAYRQCLTLNPTLGEAYWSLANLKTFRFAESDLADMQALLSGTTELGDEDCLNVNFALGKVFEDAEDYTQSFKYYAKGNALRCASNHYDADKNSVRIKQLKTTFNKGFFSDRAGFGCTAPDPIFIVGMPRSGSTLLEQILSSHSAVEGTSELPEILGMAKKLREQADSDEIAAYGAMLVSKSSIEMRELGEWYIECTRIHRKTDKPFFIDKMPNNFLHAGMILSIMPNAKIIDARRHPLGCCFSNFKQHYASGQRFSYAQEDVGRFYHDYVELMAHFDEVLPGRVHRVFYEQVIADTESEIRKLLDYCGLSFEPDCLRFYENQRPVRTASSEQVRQPIYRKGLEQWQHYESWLNPLKAALGRVLDDYPSIPRF